MTLLTGHGILCQMALESLHMIVVTATAQIAQKKSVRSTILKHVRYMYYALTTKLHVIKPIKWHNLNLLGAWNGTIKKIQVHRMQAIAQTKLVYHLLIMTKYMNVLIVQYLQK